MTNKKPYRTKDLKRQAKQMAEKTEDGHYHSPVKRITHLDNCGPTKCYCRGKSNG